MSRTEQGGRGFGDSAAHTVGILAVFTLGLSAGALLAEAAVLVPYWQSIAAEDFLAWYAANADRLLAFFGPLEVTTTVAVVAATVSYTLQRQPGAAFFAVATLLSLAVLATFPLYFQEVNARFAAGTIASKEVANELTRWATWHNARTLIAAAAFGFALLACRSPRLDFRK